MPPKRGRQAAPRPEHVIARGAVQLPGAGLGGRSVCKAVWEGKFLCKETGSYLTPPFQGQVVRGRLGGKNAAVVILTRAPCIHGPDTC